MRKILIIALIALNGCASSTKPSQVANAPKSCMVGEAIPKWSGRIPLDSYIILYASPAIKRNENRHQCLIDYLNAR